MEGINPRVTGARTATELSAGWKRNEYLFIQLHFELLHTVISLPTAPYVAWTPEYAYIAYCQYFATHGFGDNASLPEENGDMVKDMDVFFKKRNELVGALLWAIRRRHDEAVAEAEQGARLLFINGVTINWPMMQEYRRIRESIGFDTYVHDPALWPELSTFLVSNIRIQYPRLFENVSSSEGIAQEVAQTGDQVTERTPTEPEGELANTLDHDSTNEDEMSDADNDEMSDIDNDANSGEARLGPDDFAKETGNPRCTAYNTQGPNIGKRCTRRTKDRTVDRRTWECHIHDPEQQRKIQADRLRRNAAKKRNEGGK